MIVPTMILVVVLGLFFLIWNVTRDRRAGSNNVLFVNTNQNQLDIKVLGLLLSREENEYLRRCLSVREFRTIRRSRVSQARTYLRAINRQTRQIVRTAEAATLSSDPEVAGAARELLSIAFRIRLNIPIVHLCLLTEWLFPTLSLVAPAKVNAYQKLTGRFIPILRNLPRVPTMNPAA